MDSEEYAMRAVEVNAERDAVLDHLFVSGHHVDTMRWILSGTRELPKDYIAILDEAATFMHGDQHLDSRESNFQRKLLDAVYADAFNCDSTKVLKRYNAIIVS